jgi:hypothetical protein
LNWYGFYGIPILIGEIGMDAATESEMLVADRVWVATALLQKEHPERLDFTKREIRERIDSEGLLDGVRSDTLNNHLDQHCVANVPPSTGKYRMLYETTPGRLRLYRRGDRTDKQREQKLKPSKITPLPEKLPSKYLPLLAWYESWSQSQIEPPAALSWEQDPLIRLIGSGKHIWADEHADEYVNNLRREDM